MKLIFLLFVIVIIATVVYALTFKWYGQKKKNKRINLRPVSITAIVALILLVLVAFGMYTSATAPDTQCTASHTTTMKPPTSLKTAMDYFAQGDYDYDVGNCRQAITDYSKAIALNPDYAQAYNNRAYTKMRMQSYQDALPDLDKAVSLKPNYIQALMNRGDIHNYYYQIDTQAAIADYKRVIALTGPSGGNTSVCGHLFLAKHNGWNVGTFLDMLQGNQYSCNP